MFETSLPLYSTVHTFGTISNNTDKYNRKSSAPLGHALSLQVTGSIRNSLSLFGPAFILPHCFHYCPRFSNPHKITETQLQFK